MLPPTTAEELNARGHDATSLREAGLRGLEDAEVLAFAVKERRVLVTENFGDFAMLLDQRQAEVRPVTPVVFVRKSAFPSGRVLPVRLAARLDRWAQRNPDPYHGLHWP
jgi:hypothetical protein